MLLMNCYIRNKLCLNQMKKQQLKTVRNCVNFAFERERERERDRKTDRQTDRQTDRETSTLL